MEAVTASRLPLKLTSTSPMARVSATALFAGNRGCGRPLPIGPGDFRLLTGADALGDYGRSGEWGEQHHRFRKQCGIATHNDGDMPTLGGKFVMVHVAALDDLSPQDLLAAPIRCADGLNDAWQNEPQEARHL
jgi:hypothetical protein